MRENYTYKDTNTTARPTRPYQRKTNIPALAQPKRHKLRRTSEPILRFLFPTNLIDDRLSAFRCFAFLCFFPSGRRDPPHPQSNKPRADNHVEKATGVPRGLVAGASGGCCGRKDRRQAECPSRLSHARRCRLVEGLCYSTQFRPPAAVPAQYSSVECGRLKH